MATVYFSHLVEHRLAVCKECKYAVWPDQVEGHLRGKHHRMGQKQAECISDEIRGWHGLIVFPSELEVPDQVEQPITELPLFEDGLRCQKNPSNCQYICRDKMTMKKHWRKDHQWSIGGNGKGGGSGKSKDEKIGKRFQEAAKQVYCQRFFPTFQGSQYFEVRRPEQAGENQARFLQGEQLWQQVCDKANKNWEELEKKARVTIEDGEKDEVSPWLDRTQWLPYLLLAAIEEPNTNPDREEEPIAAAVWKAMDDVARISQESTTKRVGIFIRMEMMKTERHQNQPVESVEASVDVFCQDAAAARLAEPRVQIYTPAV
ncbi:hypothetical protein B0J12DRAFT_692848 [Macrophomina phaseolina]|uniref:C2H2-type domain-containing protein n=1 Tax=Macrophomina phaseolina TaxID=35725 RepID=A0ABQ8FRX3_9PEZI|nr:hypothetical protein B0J12DRAFT_692848 [Macrophomina phaseolina]